MSITSSRLQAGPPECHSLQLLHLSFLFCFLMVEPEQMQRPVDRQQGQLLAERHRSLPGSTGSDRQCDHDLTQIRRSIRTPQAVEVGIERQHVSRSILTTKPPVERPHAASICHTNGNDTRYP